MTHFVFFANEGFMKHLHMLLAVLTIGFFCYSAFCIIKQKQVGKAYMAITHTLYALLIGSGVWLLWDILKVTTSEYWIYAKIVLLVVAVSSMIKARRAKAMGQAKAGIGIVFVALVGILVLVITKPTLG